MKKNLLILVCTFYSLTALSQLPIIESSNENKQNYVSDAIVWSQPVGGPLGIVTTYFNNESNGFFATDDFELSQNYILETITVFGFNVDMNFLDDITGFDLYIYENEAGVNIPNSDPSQPGTGILELINLDFVTDGISIEHPPGTDEYHITVDITMANGGAEFVLPAGHYWLVAYPRMEVPVQNSLLWGWYEGNVTGVGLNEAHYIDIADLFNTGGTSWTPIFDIGATFNSLAFIIEGATDLGLEDHVKLSEMISIFPNPSSNIIHVKANSAIEVERIVVYSILGEDKKLVLIDGEVNISGLSSGVYALKIKTNKGTLTRKIVRL